MEREALISDCGRYRYLLRRVWDHGKPRALFVMLNPSTADATVDDPTIRSCVRLTKGLGYGSFEVINLFSLRATDPMNLAKAGVPLIGPKQEGISFSAIERCDIPICAWGAHPIARDNSSFLLGHIRSYRPAVFCFGRTKDGAPRHPLYIKTGTPLEVYR